MTNVTKAFSWFLSCLGIVMVGAAILVVPSNALADTGSNCIMTQGCTGLTGTALGNCVAPCCAVSGDPSCCSEACGSSDPNDPCYSACSGLGATCNTGCSSGCELDIPPCPAATTGCSQILTRCAGCKCTEVNGSSCYCKS
jgi:hypothetical protein